MEIDIQVMTQAAVYLRWGVAVLMYAAGRATSVGAAYRIANEFVDELMRDLEKEVGKGQ